MSSKAQAILAWLEKNRRPEIRVHYQMSSGNLPIGASKIGGCPDVPADFVWPRVQGGGSFGNPNAQPEPMEIPDKNMAMKGIYAFLPGGDAKTFEEFRVAQIAYRQETRPDFQMPTGERLEQFEKHILDQWQAMQMGKALQDELNLMGDIADMSDEEWEESFKPDPEDEKRAKMLRPLAFMAQFNLAELADCDTENRLPKAGLLSFFYDDESQDWGENPDCAKVFYFPPEMPLVRMPLPLDRAKNCDDEYIDIGELMVSFSRQSYVPSQNRAEEAFPDVDIYDELQGTAEYEQFFGEDARNGCTVKLFGWAEPIQWDMEEECQLKSMSLDWENYQNNPQIQTEVNQHKDDWILLFQLDSIYVEDKDAVLYPKLQNIPEKLLPLLWEYSSLSSMQETFDNVEVSENEMSFLGILAQTPKDLQEKLAAEQERNKQRIQEISDILQKAGITPSDDLFERNPNHRSVDIMFGDAGCLYFWIHKDDLAAKRFDKVIHIVQCH